MIEFYVNDNKVDVQLEDEKTVGEILKAFEYTCEQNQAAVIGILVDGKQITADIFDEEAAKPLGENTKFEFTIVTKNDIAESFVKLSTLFVDLSEKMEQVPMELQKGNNKEVSNSIKNLADSIDTFCNIATLASLFPDDFKTPTVAGLNFEEFFKDFSPILKDFEEALSNNDSVMIGDLSEYEICPRLKSISEALRNM